MRDFDNQVLMSSKTKYIQVLKILCFIFGVFMMCRNILYSPLWGDEWVEYHFSQWPFYGTEYNFYYAVTHTYQPPLYNFVMHFWLTINKSIIWFRFFNLIPGMISIVALYKIIMELTGKEKYACGSIIALSCCYQWIYYVQECAEYCLMLMFLFLSLLFWVRLLKYDSMKYYILFIIMISSAIYSQYGAAILGIPLIFIAFIKGIKNYNIDRSKFYFIQGGFGCGGVLAAILYIFFLRIQSARMRDVYSYNTHSFTYEDFKELPLFAGRIFRWFFMLPKYYVVFVLCSIAGVLFLIITVLYAIQMRKSVEGLLLFAFFLTYLFHFFLVKTWIYARGNVENRYSLFLLPLLITVVVSVINRFCDRLNKLKKIILVVACILILFTSTYSASLIWKNWTKAYDDVIAETYQEYVTEKGYEKKIYFCGYPSYPVLYYLEKYGYISSDIATNMTNVNVDEEQWLLQDEFFLWATGWSNENYQKIIDKAKGYGYKIEILHDYSSMGALAYCKRDKRQ